MPGIGLLLAIGLIAGGIWAYQNFFIPKPIVPYPIMFASTIVHLSPKDGT